MERGADCKSCYARNIVGSIPTSPTRRHGQVVKTSPFHGGITGSNPVGVILVDTAEKTCSNYYKKVTTTAQLVVSALTKTTVV